MFNTVDELIEGVLNHGPNILKNAPTDITNPAIQQYINKCNTEFLNYPIPPSSVRPFEWLIPKKYQQINMLEWLLNKCTTNEQIQRVHQEHQLFQQFNMAELLNVMLYLVDTFSENDVVWGVGRGSSVASYCLYLIGIHRIDSLKYNLDIYEFFHTGD